MISCLIPMWKLDSSLIKSLPTRSSDFFFSLLNFTKSEYKVQSSEDLNAQYMPKNYFSFSGFKHCS